MLLGATERGTDQTQIALQVLAAVSLVKGFLFLTVSIVFYFDV